MLPPATAIRKKLEIRAVVLGSCFCSGSEDTVTAGGLLPCAHGVNVGLSPFKWKRMVVFFISQFVLYHLYTTLSLALFWPLQVVEVLGQRFVELEGELGPGSSAGEGACGHLRSCLNSVAEEMEQVDSFLTELSYLSFAFLHNFWCRVTWLLLCQLLIFNCYPGSMLESYGLQS